jgi:hypothetical protein
MCSDILRHKKSIIERFCRSVDVRYARVKMGGTRCSLGTLLRYGAKNIEKEEMRTDKNETCGYCRLSQKL